MHMMTMLIPIWKFEMVYDVKTEEDQGRKLSI